MGQTQLPAAFEMGKLPYLFRKYTRSCLLHLYLAAVHLEKLLPKN